MIAADVPSNEIGGAPENLTNPPQMRVFVGLRIAPEIAGELARLARGLEGSSVRFISTADVHLTLVPPWNEASVVEAIERLRGVASRCDAFSLTFQHLSYGPVPRRPRLLWVECAVSDDIAALQSALVEAFWQKDERPFRPHVTLARIRGNGQAIARKHPIDLELSLIQRVESIELFQSPPPGASGYQVLASLQLGRTPHSVPTT